MQYISSSEAMHQADTYAVTQLHIPGILLMEEAARGLCERLKALCTRQDDILFLCGPGGNGGDGFACARMMRRAGYSVRVYYNGDPSRLSGDARTNFDMLMSYSISVLSQEQGAMFNHVAKESECVVDCLFGTGLSRPVEGLAAQMIRELNELHARGVFKVVSADIPSGIQADTGKILGTAVQADETVTFCRLKPGLLLYPGRECAGKVTVWDIGIPSSIAPLAESKSFLLEKGDIAGLLPQRPSRSHKGTFGRLLAAAGSHAMTGAAVFTSLAAYRVGTGLVEVVLPESARLVLQSCVPEAVTCPYEDSEDNSFDFLTAEIAHATAVACGPGLSTQPYAHSLLKKILTEIPAQIPLVLDADALNLLSRDEELCHLLDKRSQNAGSTVLTPHMGEASRLIGRSIPEIMEDPVSAVTALCDRYHSIAVLKDALTLVREPSGRLYYNSTGNNGMSTAGSGDVLTGIVGGLLAQGVPAFRAACLGVYLHGAAGDLARKKFGSRAMTASDLLSCVCPEVIDGETEA